MCQHKVCPGIRAKTTKAWDFSRAFSFLKEGAGAKPVVFSAQEPTCALIPKRNSSSPSRTRECQICRMKDYSTKRPDDWRTTAERHDQYPIAPVGSAQGNFRIAQRGRMRPPGSREAGLQNISSLSNASWKPALRALMVLSSDSNGACR